MSNTEILQQVASGKLSASEAAALLSSVPLDLDYSVSSGVAFGTEYIVRRSDGHRLIKVRPIGYVRATPRGTFRDSHVPHNVETRSVSSSSSVHPMAMMAFNSCFSSVGNDHWAHVRDTESILEGRVTATPDRENREIANRWTGYECYLNGKLAIISGRLEQFATVRTLDGGASAVYGWPTVNRIMYGTMEFKS